MRKLISLISINIILCINNLSAQDAHLSQFYAAPQLTNPALTGVFKGSLRGIINYREQWSNIFANIPFRTFCASADYRINTVDDDYIGLGINTLYHEAGTSQFAKTTASISLSYLKQLSGNRLGTENQYLVGGAQLGFGNYKINNNNLWFSEQYDLINEKVNTNLSNGETNIGNLNSNLFLDFNAGLIWYAIFSEQANLYFGGSIHHINNPNISLTKNNEPLYRRYSINMGGEFGISDELSILPMAILMKQSTAMQFIIGTSIRYSNHDWDEMAMRFGLSSRIANKLDHQLHQDALIFSTFLELNKINIGISYDINTSNLISATNSRGAFELSIQYIHPEYKKLPVTCPKF